MRRPGRLKSCRTGRRGKFTLWLEIVASDNILTDVLDTDDPLAGITNPDHRRSQLRAQRRLIEAAD
jgi:hypothetical protein